MDAEILAGRRKGHIRQGENSTAVGIAHLVLMAFLQGHTHYAAAVLSAGLLHYAEHGGEFIFFENRFTRPDYIDEEILDILSEHHVKTVEIGIQSMSDEVLSASKRGHTAERALEACRMVKDAGFDLIGQMMIGLPGSTLEFEIATAKAICNAGADGARVYPTVVFAETELADMTAGGSYKPLDIEDAIDRTASVLDVFDRAGVPTIRVGLCSGENLSSPESVVGGANHPALGELCMGELIYRRICAEADRVISTTDPKGKTMTVYVPLGATSRAVGQKKRNILRLNEKYCKKHAINRIKILEISSIIGYNIIIDLS